MGKELKGNPKKDGFRMPGEFEPHDMVYMVWPDRSDNWRNGGVPAQKAYKDVCLAISKFTPVTMLVNESQFENAFNQLASQKNISVVEMSSNDAWVRDSGPTFVINKKGERRIVNWDFNAWGGLYDGLYFPWDFDDQIPRKISSMHGFDYYSTSGFVLEGGSFHVDGEGTVLTTKMCLLSQGRNPHLKKEGIEKMLMNYLNVSKVLWVKDGIDPDETNGHIDDVACFARPGEVICIWTDDKKDPFYKQCQAAYKELSQMKDAKGRKLKVHKLCMPKKPVLLKGADTIDQISGTIPREDGDICIASYMNFLITNGAIITPQYDDVNDKLAISQLEKIFPDYKVVGVKTKEVVFGGGNIHCITQQRPV